MPLTPAERSVRARLAAFAQHAQHDTRTTTQAARAAFRKKFEDQVDPDRELSVAERERRAEAARRAYYAKLTFERLRAQRNRVPRKQTAEDQSAAGAAEEVDDGDQLCA